MRIVIADDHVLLREGLARLLSEAGFQIAGKAADADALLAAVRSEVPDVAVVDVRMPPSHTSEGIVAALRIRQEYPAVGVLVLSEYVETHHAMRLLADGSGHVGYLLKERVSAVDEFVEAVRRVGTGGAVIEPAVVTRLLSRRRERELLTDLTVREREVLALMAEGRSNHGISAYLVLSPKTVESHVNSIFTKLALAPAPDDHRRVLAVLTYLRS